MAGTACDGLVLSPAKGLSGPVEPYAAADPGKEKA